MAKFSLGMRGASAIAAAALLTGVMGQVVPAYAASHHRAQAKTTLLETGSTLLYPLFNIWVPVYTKTRSNIQITTGATGSGTGISEAEGGQVQIGASDAYLPPTAPKTLMNIPLAISAQMINYNLPGLNGRHLKLSGAVLAGIYTGKITKWNAKAIAQLNPGVKLPNHGIVPLRRLDGSGDTFIFTTYMTDSAPKVWTVGFNTSVSWPALRTEVAETGNSGMVTGLHQIPYSIAYVGISYKGQTDGYKLGEAMLQNRAGKFLLPVAATIQAAAGAMVPKTPPGEALSLVYAPGANAYPIINYEYAIISQKQASPATASAVRAFLTWCLTTGNGSGFLNRVGFQPLPKAVVRKSEAQIQKVK